jgi:hypothetical protein
MRGSEPAFAPLGTLFNGLVVLSIGVVSLIVLAFALVFGRKAQDQAKGSTGARAERMPADETTEPAQCLGCGATIPAGKSNCPVCGWEK